MGMSFLFYQSKVQQGSFCFLKVIVEALKTVELSIELRNILKFKEEANMPKVLNKTNSVSDSLPTPAAGTGNSEKRSKNKRNKNKKEKDAKNEPKLACENSALENKLNSTDGYVGGCNKPKNDTESLPEEVKGRSAVAAEGSKPLCVGRSVLSEVADNFPEAKNASKTDFCCGRAF